MSDAEFRVLLIMYLIRKRTASIIQLGRKKTASSSKNREKQQCSLEKVLDPKLPKEKETQKVKTKVSSRTCKTIFVVGKEQISLGCNIHTKIETFKPRSKFNFVENFRTRRKVYMGYIDGVLKITFLRLFLFEKWYVLTFSRAPIGAKINQCHFGDLRPFSYKAPKICPDIRGRAKKQPVPWHGGTGQMGALEHFQAISCQHLNFEKKITYGMISCIRDSKKSICI